MICTAGYDPDDCYRARKVGRCPGCESQAQTKLERKETMKVFCSDCKWLKINNCPWFEKKPTVDDLRDIHQQNPERKGGAFFGTEALQTWKFYKGDGTQTLMISSSGEIKPIGKI